MNAEPSTGASAPAVSDASFDAYYYDHCCGKPYHRTDEWLAFFQAIADRLIQDVQPGSVMDAGCALGFLVEGFRARAVEAFGQDLSSYAIDRVHESVKPYCFQGSIAEDFPRRYDLIVSIEVLEHMPTAEAERAIANFCRHSDDVVFSSSPFDYKEPTHINVHPPEYWAEQFARHGFYRDVDYDASFITAWATRFRRGTEPLHRVVRNYERRCWALQLERNDARGYAVQVQNELAAAIEQRQDYEQRWIGVQAQERMALEQLAGAQARTADVERQSGDLSRQLEEARDALRIQSGRAMEREAAIADLQDKLAAAEKELGPLRVHADGLAAALTDLQVHVSNSVSALVVTQQALAQAQDRICSMERSVFWRLRQALHGARRAMGLARD